MCGIFGVMWHDTESIPDALRLKQTAKLLEHRGPDASEIYSNPGIGLVHTRLSLVDLNPRSNQPFWDKQGRYSSEDFSVANQFLLTIYDHTSSLHNREF